MAEAAADGILAAYLAGGRVTIDPDTLALSVQERLVASGGWCAPAVTGAGMYELMGPSTVDLLDEASLILRALADTPPADAERLAVLGLMAKALATQLTDRAYLTRVREQAAAETPPPQPPRWKQARSRAAAAVARRVEQRAYAIHVAAQRRLDPDYDPDYD